VDAGSEFEQHIMLMLIGLLRKVRVYAA
jgi:hypothetical protein